MLDPYLHLIQKYPFSFLPDLALFIAVLSGILNFRYLNRAMQGLLLMAMLCLGIEVILIYYAAHRMNNHFLSNLTSLVMMVGFARAYLTQILRYQIRLGIWAVLSCYLVVFVAAFEWTRISEFLLAVERLGLLAYVILYFRSISLEMRVANLLTHSLFWVSVGIIIYAGGTLFIFLNIRFNFNSLTIFIRDYQIYWRYSLCVTTLLYSVLSAGFWLRRYEVRAQIT